MQTQLTRLDISALLPLIILLSGALILLLMESFFSKETKKTAFYVTLATFFLAFITALQMEGTESALLKPWLYFDFIAKSFTLFFLSVGMGVVFISDSFFKENESTQGEYYFLLLSAIAGLILIALSKDFLILFLGFETFSLALYVLTGYMKNWKISHEASFKYFLMGAFASAFLLYGIALIYGGAGTTSFDGLLTQYKAFEGGPNKVLFLAGIGLVTVGLCFKAAIVPFHAWAPDVYEGASLPVTSFMAVGAKAGAVAAFARVFLTALPNFDPYFPSLLVLLAMITVVYANFVGLHQFQLRRFFAYSGISHAAFLLIPIAAGTKDSLPALLFYLIVYGFATLGSFAVISSLNKTGETFLFNDLKDLFKKSPLNALILAFCLLTLAGIPPTAGFFTKFYIFKIAFEKGYYAFIVVGLLASILSAYYYLRIISLMFTKTSKEREDVLIPKEFISLFSFVCLIVLSVIPAWLLSFL